MARQQRERGSRLALEAARLPVVATAKPLPQRKRSLMTWFAVLAAYLVTHAIDGLTTHHLSDSSPFGMAFMTATVAVMFVFAWGKRRTGRPMSSRPLLANASMTFIDGCLAG